MRQKASSPHPQGSFSFPPPSPLVVLVNGGAGTRSPYDGDPSYIPFPSPSPSPTSSISPSSSSLSLLSLPHQTTVSGSISRRIPTPPLTPTRSSSSSLSTSRGRCLRYIAHPPPLLLLLFSLCALCSCVGVAVLLVLGAPLSHLTASIGADQSPDCFLSAFRQLVFPSFASAHHCGGGQGGDGVGRQWDRPGWLVEGYGNATSVEVGQALSLHLSTSTFYPALSCLAVEVGVYRFPFGAVTVDDTFLNVKSPHAHAALLPPQRVLVLKQTVEGTAWREGAHWPVSAVILVPRDWEPGLYVARVSAEPPRRSGGGGEGRERRWSNYQLPYLDIQFIVKLPLEQRGNHSSILVHIASHTSQAYNVWTGTGTEESFYSGQRSGPKTLSYRRPYAADTVNVTADHNSNFASPWQHSSVRVDMASRWELHFLLYMHDRGIPLELLSSVDLHQEGRLTVDLSRYHLFISVGHDEYWSLAMIRTVQAFIRRGGNALFLGGNAMYWKVHSPTPDHLICDKAKNQTHDLEGKKNQSRDHLGFVSSTITGLSFHGGQREASRVLKDANLYSAVRPEDDLLIHLNRASVRRFGMYGGSDGVQMAISGYEADTLLLDDFHLPVQHRADAPLNFVAIAREAFAVIGYFRNGEDCVQRRLH